MLNYYLKIFSISIHFLIISGLFSSNLFSMESYSDDPASYVLQRNFQVNIDFVSNVEKTATHLFHQRQKQDTASDMEFVEDLSKKIYGQYLSMVKDSSTIEESSMARAYQCGLSATLTIQSFPGRNVPTLIYQEVAKFGNLTEGICGKTLIPQDSVLQKDFYLIANTILLSTTNLQAMKNLASNCFKELSEFQELSIEEQKKRVEDANKNLEEVKRKAKYREFDKDMQYINKKLTQKQECVVS